MFTYPGAAAQPSQRPQTAAAAAAAAAAPDSSPSIPFSSTPVLPTRPNSVRMERFWAGDEAPLWPGMGIVGRTRLKIDAPRNTASKNYWHLMKQTKNGLIGFLFHQTFQVLSQLSKKSSNPKVYIFIDLGSCYKCKPLIQLAE